MSLTLILLIVVGGWALFNRSKIETVEDAVTLAQEQIGESIELPDFASLISSKTESKAQGPIRVATLNLGSIHSATDDSTRQILIQMIHEFDVIAVQEITLSPIELRKLVDQLNSNGREYDLVVSAAQGVFNTPRCFGFLFDRQKIQLDSAHRYQIADPDRLFQQAPFVAWFRIRSSRPETAFTFTLVNVQLKAGDPAEELVRIAAVFRAVRMDGRGEDDIVIAGDFQCGDQLLPMATGSTALQPVLLSKFTDTQGTKQLDNILIDQTATNEFVLRGGVYDFMKVFNLTTQQALSVSPRLPVWAEFSATEGGQVEKFAATADDSSLK